MVATPMDKNSNEGNSWGVDLVEFSVVLRVKNDPALLNPDFLLYNKIVDPTLPKATERCISTPAFSQAVFSNGVSVKADPERLTFEQGTSSSPLRKEKIICPGMAMRYVQKVPYLPYTAIGINPKGVWTAPADEEFGHLVASKLLGQIPQLAYKHTTPQVQMKLIYDRGAFTAYLDIVEIKKRSSDPGASAHGLIFAANFHRKLEQTTQQGRCDRLLNVLGSWHKNLEDFCNLVKTLLLRRESVH